MNIQIKSTGNFFKRDESGILFNTEFVKLKKFVANAAFLGGAFLCPPTLQSELADTLLKPTRRALFHS